MISIGTIELIKAIESFQTGKGTKLATFAARCIENEILMHLRSLKKTRKDVSLHDREKEVVIERFGLEHGGDERTQREIAKELGISRSYVSRIEKRALIKLYHEFYKAKR